MNNPKQPDDVPTDGAPSDTNPTGTTPNGIPEGQSDHEAKGRPSNARSETETACTRTSTAGPIS